MLSTEQIAQYRDQGYVMLGSVLDSAQLEGLRDTEARFRAAQHVDETRPGTHFFSQAANYSPTVREVIQSPPIVSAVLPLVGSENVIFRYNQFVTKMADRDTRQSEFPWHQDDGYTPITPPTSVTVWIALDEMTRENGCIWVLPGSHKQGLLSHSRSGVTGYQEADVAEDGVPALMQAGDAIAFSGLTLHRSLYNHTDRIRRAFFIAYADAAATFQEAHMAEPLPIVKSEHSWMVHGAVPLS